MAKNYKLAVWLVAVAVLAWWMWTSGSDMNVGQATGESIKVPVLVSFLLLTSAIVIGFALFRNRWYPLVVAVIMDVLFLLSFGFTGLNLIASVIFGALLYETYKRVGEDLRERVKINSSAILRHSLQPLVIGIFIMASFAAYQSPLAQEIEKSGRLPGQVQVWFSHLAENIAGTQLKDASPQEKKHIAQQVANEAYNQINNFFKPYYQYTPPIVAFGLFLILLALSWIFILLATVVGMAIFWILKKAKVFRIEEKEVKAEVLVV